jgi:sarcosine oxidase subunit gamma
MAEKEGILRRPALADPGGTGGMGIAPEALAIRVLPPRARLSLRMPAPLSLEESGQVAGFVLGMPMNRRTVSGARTASRLGPDEWLLCVAEVQAAAMADEMAAALSDRRHSLVDVGHRYVALAVSGARAPDVINA